MAPNDRQERRQQRVRGAGPSSVLADFGFNIPSLAPVAAKQPSQPQPRPRPTPTPVSSTPRGTSRAPVVTPQLGKRKRGSNDSQASEADTEPDELSPEQDSHVHSIERSRKVVGTVSHLREEVDDAPDELSALADPVGSVRKLGGDATPLSRLTPAKNTPVPPSSSSREKAPRADRTDTSIRSRTTAGRRSNSTDAPPETPNMPPNGPSRPSSTQSMAVATPIVAQDEGESEDELTPAQVNSATPKVVGKQPIVHVGTPDHDEADELSSPAQPETAKRIPSPTAAEGQDRRSKLARQPLGNSTVPAPAKRGRSQRRVLDEEDEVDSTPATSKPRQKKTSLGAQVPADANDSPDELSPRINQAHRRPAKQKRPVQATPRHETPVDISSGDDSDQYGPEQEGQSTIRVPPAPRQKTVKNATDQPPRKRPKFSGPRQAISVMRIKGSTVRGVTVADTTRTILEQNLDHQVQRMAERMQKTEDSSRRKKLRGDINLALAFKESLVEKLLDLQDANDTLSAGFQKRKLLRNGNVERRKEILTIQNSRQEVALEMDDEQAAFRSEKEKIEAKSKLSANMFEIQAAIQSGRERARKEDREEEGPGRPLSMLLDMVGRQVGSVGGGFLASIQHFNEGLERTAGWLEGRA